MRKKLIDLVEQGYKKYFNPNWGGDFFAVIADHLIANGVAIPVRCHECRSWERNVPNRKEYGTCYCDGFSKGREKHENGYCDKGKRRNDHDG